MPRPRIVTNAIVRAAVQRINAGERIQAVADSLGVHRDTLMLYLRVTSREPRTAKCGPEIRRVAPLWPTQATASGSVAGAPYARGYRW